MTTETRDRVWRSQRSKLQIRTIASPTQLDILNSSLERPISSDWQPADFMAEEEPLPVISVDSEGTFDSSNQDVNGWLSLIKNKIYSHPSIEDIFVSIEGSDVDVWVVIPERDLTVLDQLADIEWELLETLVSGEHPAFLIDFHIIYRCGRNVEDLAPTKAIPLSR